MKVVYLDNDGIISKIDTSDTIVPGAINLPDTFEGTVGQPWRLYQYNDTPRTIQDILALRKKAYQEEADPIYFDVVRGKATMEEWNAKIEEIKARYPKDDPSKIPY